MKRKKIEALPVPDVKKKGNIIAAELLDDTLVLFLFKKDIGYCGRYCIRRSGEYETYINGIWRAEKLSNVIYADNFKFDTEESQKTATEFADALGRGGYTFKYKIYFAESGYNSDKKDKAYERKCDRIEAEMDKIDPLPEDFEAWADRVIFGCREYAFYDKLDDIYICTACGKTHKIKNGKHNAEFFCKRSGKTAMLKKRASRVSEKSHCMVLQPFDGTHFAARHFKLVCDWVGTKKTVSVYEEIRYILSKDGIGKNKFYYGQQRNADEFEQDWFDSNPVNKRCWQEYCYPVEVEEVLKGTVYDNLGVAQMAQKGWRVFYNKIMTAHEIAKCFEYFAKGGYERLAAETSNFFWFDYRPGFIAPYGQNAAEVLKIDGQQVARLKQKNGGYRTLKWLQIERSSGCKISDEVLLLAEKHKLDPDDISDLLKRISPLKLIHYLEKQSELCGDKISQVITTWKDYISMAERLNISLESDMLFRPKDLKAAHDELVNRIQAQNDRKERDKLERQYPGVTKVCKTLKMYEWQDEDYAVVAPKSLIDIMQEGRNLNHCVGTSDRYFERIRNRESYVLFLRRTKNITQSYYTLEVEPGGVIRQKRTTGDRQTADIKEATAFLKKWQKVISKRLGEAEKSLAEKSKLARASEFKELRENGNIIRNGIFAGKLLVDVLEADLMEIEAV